MFFKKAKEIKELNQTISILEELMSDALKDLVMLETKCNLLKARCEKLSDKHWNECWQIAEYDNDLRKLKEENRKLKERVEQLEASVEKTSE